MSSPVVAPRPAALRRGDPGFRPIAVGLFCAGFTTFALLYATQPLLPALVGAYGITPGTASLSISVTTAALAVGVIPASALSERWGRRPVMVGSLAAAVVFGLAAAVVPGFALLLVLRGLEGLALAGLPAVGMAYLADEIDGEHLGGAMGLYIAGNSVGGFGGRIIVSAIADLTGSWRWALGGIALVSGAFLVAFVLVLPASRRFRPRPVGVGELLGAARAHLRDPVLRRFYAVGLLAMGVFVCAYNYVTFLLLGPPFRLPALVVGFVFVLYAVGTATSTRAGRLADRLGPRPVLLGAAGVAALGAAAMLTTLAGRRDRRPRPADRRLLRRAHRRQRLGRPPRRARPRRRLRASTSAPSTSARPSAGRSAASPTASRGGPRPSASCSCCSPCWRPWCGRCAPTAWPLPPSPARCR